MLVLPEDKDELFLIRQLQDARSGVYFSRIELVDAVMFQYQLDPSSLPRDVLHAAEKYDRAISKYNDVHAEFSIKHNLPDDED